MKTKITFILILSFLFTGFAQETEVEKKESGWEFDLTPYLWFSGLSGDLSFRDRSTPVKLEFSDLVSNLKFGIMLHGEARSGRWIILSDIVYIKLGNEDQIDLTQTPTELSMDEIIFELGGGYNILNSQDWLFVDVIGGIRYFDLSTQLDIGTRRAIDRTDNVTDPFIGVRFRTVGEKWINSARIDAGGFGIGSEVSWKANIIIGYRFSDLFSLLGGLQGYGIDYEKDTFGLDVVQGGFAIGGNFSF